MVTITENGVNVWLSANDTHAWAHRSGASWPCSQLSGRRVFAGFDSNGLCDVAIDGGRGDQDCDSAEFNACVADHLAGKLPVDHRCYDVVVGQFQQAVDHYKAK